MTTVRGFIREIRPRYLAKSQRKALADAGVSFVYEQGSKRANATRDDLERSLRSGDVVAVLHAFLLADQSKRGKTREDLWRCMDAIEARGASVWELYTGLRSSDKRQRDIMLRAAVEALARGRHKRSENDKRGRLPWEPDETAKLKAEVVWRSPKYTWKGAVIELRKQDKRWSGPKAYRIFGKRGTD